MAACKREAARLGPKGPSQQWRLKGVKALEQRSPEEKSAYFESLMARITASLQTMRASMPLKAPASSRRPPRRRLPLPTKPPASNNMTRNQ